MMLFWLFLRMASFKSDYNCCFLSSYLSFSNSRSLTSFSLSCLNLSTITLSYSLSFCSLTSVASKLSHFQLEILSYWLALFLSCLYEETSYLRRVTYSLNLAISSLPSPFWALSFSRLSWRSETRLRSEWVSFSDYRLCKWVVLRTSSHFSVSFFIRHRSLCF